MNTGNTAVDHGRWKSWSSLTTEDRLLLAYWQDMGGLLVTEVPVGNPRKAIWPEGSKVRRIDGVRILDSCPDSGEIVSFSSIGPEDFEARIKGREVEIVEVKRKLNRIVVGQAIVGVDMFRMEYGIPAILPVVVVGVGDPALELVCDRRGIRVWTG